MLHRSELTKSQIKVHVRSTRSWPSLRRTGKDDSNQYGETNFLSEPDVIRTKDKARMYESGYQEGLSSVFHSQRTISAVCKYIKNPASLTEVNLDVLVLVTDRLARASGMEI